MTTLAAFLLSGIACGQDPLEGGYARGHDPSITDPGIASMLQWLDALSPPYPVQPDLTFSKNPAADTTFSPFTRVLYNTGAPVVGGIISNPAKFDITQKPPSSVSMVPV